VVEEEHPTHKRVEQTEKSAGTKPTVETDFLDDPLSTVGVVQEVFCEVTNVPPSFHSQGVDSLIFNAEVKDVLVRLG